MARKVSVGGQAVIEGVMMRGSSSIATAVRKSDGDIEVSVEKFTPYTKRNRIFGLPVVRGFVALIESLVIGINALNKSAEYFEDEVEETKLDAWFKSVFKEKSNAVVNAITLMIALAAAVGLFFILPTFAASIFVYAGIKDPFALNIFEGLIRVGIFLLYVFLIGKMEDIHRVFQYHGAEHKAIFCYENDRPLTAENAGDFGRLHPRCGTNFMFLVMIVSIIVFSMTGWETLWSRIVSRVILLPVVSGITYELIKWMGRSNSKMSQMLSYPGLMLQKLTTREPDIDQIEVAIAALKAAEGITEDGEYNVQ
ncbi:MAG: putative metal-dependent protein [Firmicutes bacterium]|nr:putative metal-dependent protein [Bacillota bacterium]